VLQLNDVYFVDKQTGWAVGEKGTILYISDGGSNWQIQNNSAQAFLNSVHFVDKQTGWAVGSNGTILKYNCNSTVSVPEIGTPIALYPNPTTGLLRIQGLPRESALTVTDLMGRIMLPQQKITEAEFSLDIPTLPAGWYILQINANGKMLSYKVRKE
jgi:hypothetical protein